MADNRKTIVQTLTNNDWAPYGTDSSSASSVTLFTNSQSGGSNPNYQALISSGRDASNAYIRKGVDSYEPTSSYSSSRYTYTDKKMYVCSTSKVSPVPGVGFLNSIPSDTSLANEALRKMKNFIAQDSNQFQGLVNIAELSEMRGLIVSAADIALGAVSALRDLRHGRLPRAIRTSGGRSRTLWGYASDIWLTYSFGVKPLVGSINDLSTSISNYHDRVNGKGSIARYSGSSTKSWVTTGGTGSFGPCPGLSPAAYRERLEHKLQYKYYCGYKMFIASANGYGVVDHYGLGLKQLPVVGWELLPFSWIADYFVNVGEYLEDNFTSPSGSTLFCGLNKKYTCSASVGIDYAPVPKPVAPYYFREQSFDIEPGQARGFSFERSILSNLPHLSLQVKSVDRVGKNAVNKLLNMVSVLLSRR